MWTLIASALEWLLGLLFKPKPADPIADATARGEAQGQAEERAATDESSIKTIEEAAQIRQAQRAADQSPGPGGLRSDDGFGRD